jgi:hypothetical protein
MKRDGVDFHLVEAHQAQIHIRLENWGLWAKARAPGSDPSTSPMFRLYRASWARTEYGATTAATPVDGLDAQRIAKGVAVLPEQHRIGLQWYYVRPTSPARACRMLATTMAGLALYVRDGRQMLLNRGV